MTLSEMTLRQHPHARMLSKASTKEGWYTIDWNIAHQCLAHPIDAAPFNFYVTRLRLIAAVRDALCR